MGKLFLVITLVWLVLFALRILQIGGLDPTYRDSESLLFESFRSSLSENIKSIIPYPQSALLSGIILGTENLPFSLKEDLKITSTIHMVVVSGQNLSILAGFIMILVPYLGRKKVIALTLPTILFYSLLTGFQVPVIRAAIMVSLTYLAQMFGKERLGWWVLLLTAVVMLLWNPNWLLSISFQLSFLATLAVVVIGPILSRTLWFVPKILKEDLAITLGAQALTLPIIAYNFGQISLVGILANVFTIWTMPIVMMSGFLSLGAGMINVALGQVVGLVPAILLTYFMYVVQFFAHLPFSSLSIGETGPMVWMGYYLIVGAMAWGMAKKDLRS